MEEIDIIELLKRVKEGNAPKEIEINGTKYEFIEDCSDIFGIYQTKGHDDWLDYDVTLDIRIKILNKPIIEELEIDLDNTWAHNLYMLEIKINEIIKHINKEEK